MQRIVGEAVSQHGVIQLHVVSNGVGVEMGISYPQTLMVSLAGVQEVIFPGTLLKVVACNFKHIGQDIIVKPQWCVSLERIDSPRLSTNHHHGPTMHP